MHFKLLTWMYPPRGASPRIPLTLAHPQGPWRGDRIRWLPN